MSTRREAGRAAIGRAALHLVAVITLLAALGALAPRDAAAAKKKSSSHKTESTTHHAAAKVDINTATETDLEDLPGIGTVLAQKIISGRPYKSVADLKHAGIPANVVAGLKGHVMASRVTTGEPRARATTASRPRTRSEAKEKPTATAAEKPAAKPAPKAAASGQRTFFGIPIGGPAKKEEANPAARSEGSAESKSEARSGSASSMEEPHAALQPPEKGMVWVNTDTKVYHVEGDRWYGATKHGKWMWEDQAVREGFRASQQYKKP